jgi:hypothetical protein
MMMSREKTPRPHQLKYIKIERLKPKNIEKQLFFRIFLFFERLDFLIDTL